MTFNSPRNIVRAVRRKDAIDEAKSSVRALYSALVQQLTEHYHPADILETETIHDVAAALARLKRARVYEERLFELAFGPDAIEPARKEFDRVSKYADALLRQVHRGTVNLMKLQQARCRQEKKSRREIARAASSHVN